MRQISLGLLALLCACQEPPRTAHAAAVAQRQLQDAGVEGATLTPTEASQAGQYLFQVEGKRGEKSVLGAAEVRLRTGEAPEVHLNLFEVPR